LTIEMAMIGSRVVDNRDGNDETKKKNLVSSNRIRCSNSNSIITSIPSSDDYMKINRLILW
jgi:hypothetical protein